jgi:hypothetical protein
MSPPGGWAVCCAGQRVGLPGAQRSLAMRGGAGVRGAPSWCPAGAAALLLPWRLGKPLTAGSKGCPQPPIPGHSHAPPPYPHAHTRRYRAVARCLGGTGASYGSTGGAGGGGGAGVTAVDWSLDGAWLLVARASRDVTAHEAATGKRVRRAGEGGAPGCHTPRDRRAPPARGLGIAGQLGWQHTRVSLWLLPPPSTQPSSAALPLLLPAPCPRSTAPRATCSGRQAPACGDSP